MNTNESVAMIDMVLPMYTSDSADDNVEPSVQKTQVQVTSDCSMEHPQIESLLVTDDVGEFYFRCIWNNRSGEELTEEYDDSASSAGGRRCVPPARPQCGIEQGSLFGLSNQGVSSLFRNITDGKVDVVKRCLQSRKGTDQYLEPWLFVAAKAGNVQVFSLLVNCGFDPNKRLKLGQAPMHYAAYYGNVNIVQFLAMSGQSVDLKDAMSNTPIHYAADARRDNRNMIEFLVHRHTNEKMTSDFLNTISDSGSSPLLIAIWRRNFEHVKCLCELGAVPRFDDYRMAVLKHDVKILLYLMQRKTPDPLTEDGDAPTTTGSHSETGYNSEEDSLLYLACEIGNPDVRSQIVRTLLAYGYEIKRNVQWICDSDISVFKKLKGKTLYNYLRTCMSCVHSLTYLAAVKIRQSFPSVVDRFPVPAPVKDLIKLTDPYVKSGNLHDQT